MQTHISVCPFYMCVYSCSLYVFMCVCVYISSLFCPEPLNHLRISCSQYDPATLNSLACVSWGGGRSPAYKELSHQEMSPLTQCSRQMCRSQSVVPSSPVVAFRVFLTSIQGPVRDWTVHCVSSTSVWPPLTQNYFLSFFVSSDTGIFEDFGCLFLKRNFHLDV